MSRRWGLLVIVVAAVLLPSAVIAADDDPVSEPGVREVLSRAPSAVVMAYTWDINRDDARIFVLGPDGKNVTTTAPEVDTNNVSVQLDFDLKPGTYSVYYRANDQEGGLIGGAYQFAIGTGTFTDLKTPRSWTGSVEEPKIFQGTNPNQPASKDDPPPETQAPGIEIVQEDGTVERLDNEPQAPASATPDDTTSASTRQPWLIGGGLALVAIIAVAAVVLARRRTGPSAYAGKRARRESDDEPSDSV